MGMDRITCLKNGRWTDVQFHCQILDCGYPQYLRNGYFTFNSTTFGSRAYYFCNKGTFTLHISEGVP